MSCAPSGGPQTSVTLFGEIKDLRNADQWRRFVDTYLPFLANMLRRRGIPAEDIPDVVQETFVAVVDHIGDFEYDPRKRFRGWLATIALRKAWRHQQRAKRGGAALGGTANLDLLDNVSGGPGEGDEERRVPILLGRLRAALSDLEWQVFEMTVVRDVSVADAAERLGIALGYLYVCRSRAKRTLLQLLEQGDE